MKLDDGFFDHPKVIAVGQDAAWLYLVALCWSARNLTDGFLPADAVSKIARSSGKDRRQIEKLCRTSLWKKVRGGWQINDFLDYNLSREKVLARRAKWAEAKRGSAVESAVDSAVESDAEGTAESAVDSAAPVPSPITTYTPLRVLEGAVDNSRGLGTTHLDVITRLVADERGAANGVRNPDAWAKTVTARLETEHGQHIDQLLADFPRAPADVLAATIRGDSHSLRYYGPE